jgi:hypothetical protein
MLWHSQSAQPAGSRWAIHTADMCPKGAGFVLLATLARPHYDVVVPDLDDDTLGRLDAGFDAAVRNPGRR